MSISRPWPGLPDTCWKHAMRMRCASLSASLCVCDLSLCLSAHLPRAVVCGIHTGHFYYHVKAGSSPAELATSRRPPTAPATPPPPTFRNAFLSAPAEASEKALGWRQPIDHPWQHGPPHVMLGIRPPRPPGSSHGFGLGEEHAAMAASYSTGSGYSSRARARP